LRSLAAKKFSASPPACRRVFPAPLNACGTRGFRRFPLIQIIQFVKEKCFIIERIPMANFARENAWKAAAAVPGIPFKTAGDITDAIKN